MSLSHHIISYHTMSWYLMIYHITIIWGLGRIPFPNSFANLSKRNLPSHKGHIFTTRDAVFYPVIVYPNRFFSDLSRLFPPSGITAKTPFAVIFWMRPVNLAYVKLFMGLRSALIYHIISYPSFLRFFFPLWLDFTFSICSGSSWQSCLEQKSSDSNWTPIRHQTNQTNLTSAGVTARWAAALPHS